jgi:hypothetical protein
MLRAQQKHNHVDKILSMSFAEWITSGRTELILLEAQLRLSTFHIQIHVTIFEHRTELTNRRPTVFRSNVIGSKIEDRSFKVHAVKLEMYRIAIFNVRPEPDSARIVSDMFAIKLLLSRSPVT